MPYPQYSERWCPHCRKNVRGIKHGPNMIKCSECGAKLKMEQRDYIDIVTGTFGMHRRGWR